MPNLVEIVTRMTLKIEEKQRLSEEELVVLVETMVKNEIEPGGPYLLNQIVNPELNARIFKLFLLFNKELPKVEQYLNYHFNNELSSDEFKILLKEIHTIRRKNQQVSVTAHFNTPVFYHDLILKYSTEIQHYANIFGKKIQKADNKGEITNLANLFNLSLKNPVEVADHNLEILGQINYLIWVAYSIYDAIIDDDIELGALSTANIVLREALKLNNSLPIDPNVLIELIDKVDSANAWEIVHGRFITEKSSVRLKNIPTDIDLINLLSRRAIAHVAGIIIISKLNNFNNKKLKLLKEAMQDYCIARQLNDDLHDWIDDFENSRYTLVIVNLLTKSTINNGVHSQKKLLSIMKKRFYDSELENICRYIESLINQSIIKLEKIDVNQDSIFVNQIIKPIRTKAIRARKQHYINKMCVKNVSF